MSSGVTANPARANCAAAPTDQFRRPGNRLKYLLSAAFLLTPIHALQAETLHDALFRAYQANPTLNAARKGTQAVGENLNRAEAGYKPRVNATADGGYYTEKDKYPPDSGLSPSSLQSPSDNTYAVTTHPRGVGVSVSETVFDGLRTKNSILQAQAGILGAQAATATVEQNTLFQAVSAYVDVLADTAILNRIQRNINDLSEQLQQTREKYCFGDVTKADVAQVEARLAATKAQFSAAEANLRTSIANYGQAVGSEPQKLLPARAVDELVPPSLDHVVKIALADNPSIHAAVYGIHTALLNVQIIHGELLPTVSLTGLLNHRHDVTIPGDQQMTGSLVGRISIPIYEGGEVVARESQAKYTAAQRALEADAVREQVRAGAASTWAVFVAAKNRVASARIQLTAAQTALEGIREEWDLGDRTMREVLDSEQDYLAAEVNLTVAERDRIVASYALAQVMGKLTLATVGALNLNGGSDPAFAPVRTSVKFAPLADKTDSKPEAGGTTPVPAGCGQKAAAVGAWPLRLKAASEPAIPGPPGNAFALRLGRETTP
jgi:outer membrane protein